MSFEIFSTMLDGMPAGARSAIHEPDSPPGTPASAIVGTSGSATFLFACVTARPFSLPALMVPGAVERRGDRDAPVPSRGGGPALRDGVAGPVPLLSAIAGPPPLCGTWASFVPKGSWKSSAVRCGEPPCPELAYVTFSGFGAG